MHPRLLLERLGLHASKARGQNFLTQPATAQAIVASAAIGPEDFVVEIGPGLGALTVAAGRLASRVLAVEIDRGVHRALLDVLAEEGLQNVEARLMDALDLDWPATREQAGRPLVVIGNLPYNITSPLLFALLAAAPCWRAATLMVQKEVATRLAAKPGGKDWGRLGVMVQSLCQVRAGVTLSRGQFFPEPNVSSQIVHLTPLEQPLPAALGLSQAWFGQVVKAAFGQRRKTVANALAGGLGLERGRVEDALGRAAVAPSRRAETLSIAELGAIALALTPPGPPN
ncbi:16S rRNA (adenine(1518)-N(6)/adenine(1519)-N(6))-dimethyltransferase RsmA [Desulfarculus baarsii]